MQPRARRGDKHRIEQVTGHRHPGVAHQAAQIQEVVKSRILHKKARRVQKQLTERFEGIIDDIQDRDDHYYRKQRQNEQVEHVSCHAARLLDPQQMPEKPANRAAMHR